jgi:ribosomal protein L37E
MEDKTVLCPRCGVNRYTPYDAGVDMTDEAPYPALSRLDNKTYICSPCGTGEALRDFTRKAPVPPDEWPVKDSAA